MKPEKVYFSLGSNMGNPLDNLLKAVMALQEQVLESWDISGIYQTAALGYTKQEDFLNLVLGGETRHSAEQTLEACLAIEQKLGRVRTIRWGPRLIDIDLLMFGTERIETEKLQIPHPRMKERAFVLIPLRELDPGCFAQLKVDLPAQKVDLRFTADDVKIMLKQRYTASSSEEL